MPSHSWIQPEGGNRQFGSEIKILDIFFNSPIIILDLLPVRHAARPGRGYFLGEGIVPDEPPLKHAIASIDGQSLYHSVPESSGYFRLAYDVKALSQRISLKVFLFIPGKGHLTGCQSGCDKIFMSP